MEKIQILYHSKEIEKIEKISKGDWIDLRAAEEVHLKKGEYTLISLGVSMKLPEGYEVHIAPRSSKSNSTDLQLITQNLPQKIIH